MGLPIWRESSDTKATNTCCAASSSSTTNPKPPSDLTPQHRAARSAIRRLPSVRYPRGSRPSHLHPLSHAYLRGSLRSPPPAPPSRAIPPVPPLPSQGEQSQDHRHDSRSTPPNVLVLPPPGPGDVSASPRHGTFFSEVSHGSLRPRSRRGSILNERSVASPSAIDELPPLRRMNGRTINERHQQRTAFAGPDDEDEDELMALEVLNDMTRTSARSLGDRSRSLSPDADQWETLLTTITPDPSLPVSAETSFNTAASSFPSQRDRSGIRARSTRTGRPLRPIETPLSPLSQPLNLDPAPPAEGIAPLSPSVHEDSDDGIGTHHALADDTAHHRTSRVDHRAALIDLNRAISSLRIRTSHLISRFCSLATSFGEDLSADSDALDDPHEADGRPESRTTEIRALVDDVNALHESLERTVRVRAEARAHRVSHDESLRVIHRQQWASVGARQQEHSSTYQPYPGHSSRQHISSLVRPRGIGRSIQERRRAPLEERDYVSLTDVLDDREGILTRLRSQDESIRDRALQQLPPDSREAVLEALARSQLSHRDSPSAASRSTPPASLGDANNMTSEERRQLIVARNSVVEMEQILSVMEQVAMEPGVSESQLRELENARARLERMRHLLGVVESHASSVSD